MEPTLCADINVVLTHNIKALGEDKYITLLVLAMLQDASLHMEIGDTLLLYTDGVTDAVDGNGDRFSKKHLEDALRQLYDRSTEAIKDGILSALEQIHTNIENGMVSITAEIPTEKWGVDHE